MKRAPAAIAVRLARRAALGAIPVALALAASGQPSRAQRPQSPTMAPRPAFTVGDSVVRQGRFMARALSRDTIVSTYPRAAREVRFRFSINGLENEFPGGTEHTIWLRPVNGRLTTPLYRFGDETEPPPPTPEQSASSEDALAQVTFRVDLRHVRDALRTQGHYQPPLGDRVTELRSVFVLGDPEPLTWDYGRLKPGSALELKDADGDGIWEGTVPIATEYTRPRDARGRAVWARSRDLSRFPRLESAQPMQDALYRMSLEELLQLVRDDGALAAGAKWPGVWTRDVSLASILSLALVAPDAVKASLLAKVDASGRIIQDTGTGGSWPNSSDRMVWALAAWELYAATGDRDWLRRSYEIIRRSAEADLHAVRDEATGLFNGESSFLDWREQSYPRWMQPADIYRSQNLGTNAAHYAAYRILADLSRALGEPHARWDSVADGIQRGMTAHLWDDALGRYGQFRYGRVHMSLSPRAEGLGLALASIYGAASLMQRQSLMRRAPIVAYGTPTFWPYIPGERFYHNGTIWPFVAAYWTWAAAEGGNTAQVRHGLDNLTRAAALFLTNKENMVAGTGHYEGTALNSDRQLWSVAGMLAATYRLLLGIRLEPERMVFRPMVPPSYGGVRTMRGLRYRGATLDVTVRGHGDSVASVTIDGRRVATAEVPATLTGTHRVEITMNRRWPRREMNLVTSRFAPATPRAGLVRGRRMEWIAVPGAARYEVYRNGVARGSTTGSWAQPQPETDVAEYQVAAVSADGTRSFLSEPLRVGPDSSVIVARPPGELEKEHAGYTGAGYLRLTTERNTEVPMIVNVTRAGEYALDVRYANGNGPVNTEDKTGIRTVLVDGDTLGVIVLPQRGVNRWNEWGWSNALRVRLARGEHVVTIVYGPLDRNMNGRENTALLDHIRLTRLADSP